MTTAADGFRCPACGEPLNGLVYFGDADANRWHLHCASAVLAIIAMTVVTEERRELMRRLVGELDMPSHAQIGKEFTLKPPPDGE